MLLSMQCSCSAGRCTVCYPFNERWEAKPRWLDESHQLSYSEFKLCANVEAQCSHMEQRMRDCVACLCLCKPLSITVLLCKWYLMNALSLFTVMNNSVLCCCSSLRLSGRTVAGCGSKQLETEAIKACPTRHEGVRLDGGRLLPRCVAS